MLEKKYSRVTLNPHKYIDWFSNSQHEFGPGKSKITAWEQKTGIIFKKNILKKSYTLFVLLDIKEDFDQGRNNFPNYLEKWIYSFLEPPTTASTLKDKEHNTSNTLPKKIHVYVYNL